MSYFANTPLPVLLVLAVGTGVALFLLLGPRQQRGPGSGGAAVWIVVPFILGIAGFVVWILIRTIRTTGWDLLH
jgi:hypothetical protein